MPLRAAPKKQTNVASQVSKRAGFESARRGAVLISGMPEMIVCARQGNPPLRFKGRLLTHHWAHMSWEHSINVDLFQRLKHQLVLSYSVVSGSKIASHAVQMPDMHSATKHLETTCDTFATAKIDPGTDSLASVDMHFRLCFGQHFALLIADVLNDWHSLSIFSERA